MKQLCEICSGSRIVRLPVRRPVTAAFDASAAMAIEEAWRDYPCPECGVSVDMDRVAVLDTHAVVDSRISDPQFQEHVRRSAAHRLVEHLLKDDYIAFESGKPDNTFLRFPMVATLGVVSKGAVATLESRIASRQDEFAKAVVVEADKQIDNWGSYYGHSDILKRDARRLIGEALKTVSATWSKANATAAKPE